MIDALIVTTLALALVAAVIHLGIFVLESILWPRPEVWRLFGLRSQTDADTLQPMAYNQGFYNAFLALGALAGSVMVAVEGLRGAGVALLGFALLSMALAALVLVSSQPRLWRAALVQGLAPALGVIALAVTLSLGAQPA